MAKLSKLEKGVAAAGGLALMFVVGKKLIDAFRKPVNPEPVGEIDGEVTEYEVEGEVTDSDN